MDDNPYQAPLSRPTAVNRGSFARDLVTVGIAVGVMAVIPMADPWLVARGWGPFHVPLLLMIVILICPAVTGAMIHRPSVGIAGIAVLWAIWIVSGAITSLASLSSIMLDWLTGIGVVLFGVHLAAFLVPWWITAQARSYNETESA